MNRSEFPMVAAYEAEARNGEEHRTLVSRHGLSPAVSALRSVDTLLP